MAGPKDPSSTTAQPTPAVACPCANDVSVDDSMALIFSNKAPLPVDEKIRTARGIRTKDDYKAVWTWTPKQPDPSLLLFFHGNHHYVTVDKLDAPAKQYGKEKKAGPKLPSRMPDWAENDERAITGVINNSPAVGLYYKLHKLEDSQAKLPAVAGTTKKPVVLVPEDVELYEKGDFARPTPNQYADKGQLKGLIEDCYFHLRCLPNQPDSKPCGPMKSGARPYLVPTKDQSGPSYPANLKRLYLCGHSGGGKPMLECAASELVLSGKIPIDLWLLDATYNWNRSYGTSGNADLTNYDVLCRQWFDGGQLGNGPSANRFVCVFREGTDTEAKANDLLHMLTKSLKPLKPKLIDKRIGTDIDKDLIPALGKSPVLFIKIKVDRKKEDKPDELEPNMEHEELPTRFIPWLLWTAGS